MSFKARFKGRTMLIGKGGVEAMIVKKSDPIDKISSTNRSQFENSGYSFRSLRPKRGRYESDANTEASPTYQSVHYSRHLKNSSMSDRIDQRVGREAKMSPTRVNSDEGSYNERHGSQIYKKRRLFESERKGKMQNLYNSIVRNERSANITIAKGNFTHSKRNHDIMALNPRWNSNLVKDPGMAKRRLFHDQFSSLNNSVSLSGDKKSKMIDSIKSIELPVKSDVNYTMMEDDEPKSCDILILDKHSDLGDYDTRVSMFSNNLNRSFNRSQKLGQMIMDKRISNKKSRYKPFTLRDYQKNNSEGRENLYASSGGLGPEIGSKKWIQEKIKRERIKEFSDRIANMKKESFTIKKPVINQ